MFEISPHLAVGAFIQRLEEAGVKVNPRGGRMFRAVTHRMVSSADIDEALTHIEAVCCKTKQND
jgi:acetylornithine/succinyldiaminopimelate/putrescine aminotransferase